MQRRVRLTAGVLYHFGWRWALFRAQYALAQKSGWQTWRWRAQPWAARPLAMWLRPGIPSSPSAYVEWRRAHASHFFFAVCPRLQGYASAAVAESDQLLKGQWRYFEHTVLPAGFPPRWHHNPLHDRTAPGDQHWSRIGDGQYGDIKLIWEPSRFAVAYGLARAYAATGDERYPAAFWALVEDWAAHNPPMLGPNWRCGQETSFRIMAWCFGLWAFAHSPHTTPERTARMTHWLAWQAERVEANIAYARSQKNNHAISEGVGLWTVGLLFPELAAAERWRTQGRRVLEEEAMRQIYADGAYVQHSLNYQRVMLHDYLWALRLGDLNDQRLSPAVYDRVAQAAEFLFQLTDPVSGQAANYGANDGALVLPISDCDFTDYRPTLQASHVLLHRMRLYPPGPWDEALIWLLSEEAKQTPQITRAPESLTASTSGYFTLRGPESWAFLRCASYTDRPSHADQLHLDVWWRGINVVCDAGTYLYNSSAAWDNGLSRTSVHNTLTVAGHDQMLRAGRFLWLDWAKGRARRIAHPAAEIVEGEHDGYRALGLTHRRAVIRIRDAWVIVDDVVGAGSHTARLQWLFADADHAFNAQTGHLHLRHPIGEWIAQVWAKAPMETTLVRAGERGNETRGWRSRYYANKEPALSLVCEAQAPLPLRFVTVMAPDSSIVVIVQSRIVTVGLGGWGPTLTLNQPGLPDIVQQVSVDSFLR